jgi:hypothetical protein
MASDGGGRKDAGVAAPPAGLRDGDSPSCDKKTHESVRDAIEAERDNEHRYQSAILLRLRNAAG